MEIGSAVPALSQTARAVCAVWHSFWIRKKANTRKRKNGCIAAQVIVDGNRSEFALSVSEDPPVTVLTVQMRTPCEGLSEKGGMRALCYLADRVEQLLENEMELSQTSCPA